MTTQERARELVNEIHEKMEELYALWSKEFEALNRVIGIECPLGQSFKNVLNIDEVCSLTGLRKSTVYKFTHRGTIPHYKQAKHLFFDRAEIESWLKENKGYNTDVTKMAAHSYVTLKSKRGLSH